MHKLNNANEVDFGSWTCLGLITLTQLNLWGGNQLPPCVISWTSFWKLHWNRLFPKALFVSSFWSLIPPSFKFYFEHAIQLSYDFHQDLSNAMSHTPIKVIMGRSYWKSKCQFDFRCFFWPQLLIQWKFIILQIRFIIEMVIILNLDFTFMSP